jgi:hypothetical protein
MAQQAFLLPDKGKEEPIRRDAGQIGVFQQPVNLSGSPQSIPQYIEVPPNMKAKRIISYFSAVLSYSSNPSLLKDDSKLLIFSGCWQTICNGYLYGSRHHSNEGPF